LTCITCQVKFSLADLHREHFKGDWHRYNLKRKVASLPVVTSEAFEQRKEAHENQVKLENKEMKHEGNYCIACGKNFKNVKAYENHIQSKKHQDMILKFESKPTHVTAFTSEDEDDSDDGMEVEEVDSDEWEDDPILNTDCLFCSHHSASLEKNLVHMTAAHSFFLPDPEFITNLEGFIDYLGAKVGQGKMCLWCNDSGKSFSAAADVQRHMVDKGHCKLLHTGESLVEYDQWYDYSTSYPGEMQQDPESEPDLQVLDDTGFQLVLPSGTKIGHRSLLRYYRQSLNPERALVVTERNSRVRHHLLSTYRALGWTGSSGAAAVVKARDLGYMRRLQNKNSLKLGFKGNNQKHFKDRNGMCM